MSNGWGVDSGTPGTMPTEMASQSTPVSLTNRSASATSV
jgi:hypothetical protein